MEEQFDETTRSASRVSLGTQEQKERAETEDLEKHKERSEREMHLQPVSNNSSEPALPLPLTSAATTTTTIPPPTTATLQRQNVCDRRGPMAQPGAVLIPAAATASSPCPSQPLRQPPSRQSSTGLAQNLSIVSPTASRQPTYSQRTISQQSLISAALVDGSGDLLERIQQVEERQKVLEREREDMTLNPGILTATVVSAESKQPIPTRQRCFCISLVSILFIVAIVSAVILLFFLGGDDSSAATSIEASLPPAAASTAPPSEAPTEALLNRTEIVMSYIYDIPPSNIGNLSATTQQALEWLKNDDMDTSTLKEGEAMLLDVDKVIERFALAKLFYDLKGVEWYDSANWLSHSRSICSWLGITCDSYARVQAILAGDGNLRGALPSEIGVFTNLETLDLYANSIWGSIPTEIGLLTKMESIDLHKNAFTGTIPTEIGNLRNLFYVDLDENCLTGTFPTELGSLFLLTDLYISTNLIQGDINPIFCDNDLQYPVPPYLITDCNLAGVTCDCCKICCNHRKCRGDGIIYDVAKPRQCWPNNL